MLLQEPVHLVEVDLLLKGQRIPLAEAYPAGHYFALVADAGRRPNCDVYAWTMRQALPHIPIPLRSPDPAVRIDLAKQERLDENIIHHTAWLLHSGFHR